MSGASGWSKASVSRTLNSTLNSVNLNRRKDPPKDRPYQPPHGRSKQRNGINAAPAILVTHHEIAPCTVRIPTQRLFELVVVLVAVLTSPWHREDYILEPSCLGIE